MLGSSQPRPVPSACRFKHLRPSGASAAAGGPDVEADHCAGVVVSVVQLDCNTRLRTSAEEAMRTVWATTYATPPNPDSPDWRGQTKRTASTCHGWGGQEAGVKQASSDAALGRLLHRVPELSTDLAPREAWAPREPQNQLCRFARYESHRFSPEAIQTAAFPIQRYYSWHVL